MGFSLLVVGRGYSPVAMHRLLVMLASLGAEHQLWGAQASVVAAHGLTSCGSWLQSTGPTVVAHGLSCAAWHVGSS